MMDSPGAGGVKAQFHIAALGVKLGRAVADEHIAGLVAGVDAHARVALLLREMKVALQTGQGFKPALQCRRPGP